MLHARRLRPGEGMTADEPLVRQTSLGDDALGRTDIGDDGGRARAPKRRADGRREHPYGCSHEHHIRALYSPGEVPCLLVDRAQLQGEGAHALVGVIPAHLRARPPACRQADRAADQPKPEDRDPHARVRVSIRLR